VRAKEKYISGLSDKRIKKTSLFIRIITITMFLIVIYDSLRYNIPFYYILFLIAGTIVGQLFMVSHRVWFNKLNQNLILQTNAWSVVIMIILIAMRFIVGPMVLKALHFVWVSDALLLFFVGIYRSKWQVIIKQIDDIFYRLLPTSNKNQNK
jgi:hypothetical protein